MPKKPTDALLSFLFHDIDDLTSPHPLLLNRLTSEFGKAKVHALLEQKLLKLAGYQTTFECPEDCPERCVLAVERDADGNLFGYCGREDMAAIPIAKDDLKAWISFRSPTSSPTPSDASPSATKLPASSSRAISRAAGSESRPGRR